MHGSNFQRSLRLGKLFLLKPSYVFHYLNICVNNIKKKTPLDLGMPWISLDAIHFLQGFVKPHHSVAEYGGGGSSIFFAKRAKNVLVIESNKSWADKIKHKVKELKLDNTEIEFLNYEPTEPESFMRSGFVESIKKNTYDIILIDNLDKLFNLRPMCFSFAENHIKPGGCIIVDDSWRYKSIRKKNKAKSWKEFSSIGPGRSGVTTTDIYFYVYPLLLTAFF